MWSSWYLTDKAVERLRPQRCWRQENKENDVHITYLQQKSSQEVVRACVRACRSTCLERLLSGEVTNYKHELYRYLNKYLYLCKQTTILYEYPKFKLKTSFIFIKNWKTWVCMKFFANENNSQTATRTFRISKL